MSKQSSELTTRPVSIAVIDQPTVTAVALLCATAAIVIGLVLTRPLDSGDLPAIAFFGVLYGGTLLLAYRLADGVHVGLSQVVLTAALLSFNGNSAIVVGLIGAVLAELGRGIWYRSLSFPRHTFSRALTAVGFNAGWVAIAALVAENAYQSLGGDFPLASLNAHAVAPLVVVFMIVGVTQVAALAGAFILSRRSAARVSPSRLLIQLLIVEVLSLPFSALLAIVFQQLSLLSFVILTGGLVIAALLYRMWGVSRQSLVRRAAELNMVTRFGQALMANLSLNELLGVLHRQIEQLIDAEMFAVGLYRAETNTISYVYAVQGNQTLQWPPTEPDANGLFHYIGRQRQPVLLRGNVAEQLVQMGVDPLLPPYPVCYLGVPLIAGDRLVGMMSIESLSDPDAYEEKDLELVKLLAPQAAVALYNADLFSRLSGMTGELSQISDLSQTIGTTLNLELTLNTICQALIRLMRADRAGVYLCSEDGKTVSLVASSGLSADFAAQFRNIPIDNDGLMALIMRHPQPVSIADLYTDPRGLGWRSIAEVEGYAAIATAPMRVNERIIGLLSVFYNVPRTVSTEELTLLNTLANQVAAAVATARLFSEAQQRAEDMAHVVESSYALSESLDLEAIGQALAPRLAALLALDTVAVFVVNAEGRPLHRLASFGNWPSPDALLGHPTVSMAIRKQQSLTLPERAEDRELLDTLHLQTALVWPLVARSATIGLVVLGNRQPRHFITHERQLLETLLNQAATALDNARMFQLIDTELDERLRQLSALERVSQRMTAALNVPVVIEEVLKAAMSVTYAETASCGLAEHPGQLDFTGRIRPALTQHTVLPIGQGISWRVMRTGQPVLCDDVSLDPDYVASHPGIRSELCVPILSAGKPIGVLDLESIRPAAFNASHEAFLTTLADHAALAIAQARLFAEIRRGNDQMQTILDATRDGVLLMSAEGRLIRNNPAAERLLGRSLAPLIGRSALRLLVLALREPWTQLEAGMSRQEFKRRLAVLNIDPDRETHGQYRIQTRDAVFEIDESSFPIYDESHQLLARMFVLRDVSRERALERLRDQMTDMLVHDLRSPLASVITSLSLASDQTAHGDFAGLDYVLQIAMQNADDLLLKVEAILEVRRMENGQIPLKRFPTRLIEPVRDAIRALEASATTASIQLNTRLPPDLPPLNIDPFQIARVLINLLDNALKYTPEGKEIRIEAETMPGGRLIKVSVVDTGPGIPVNLRRQIFDLFVAFSSQAVRGRRGMGLGLTFCRLMVEAHGGTIWADVGPEGGAAMNFTLPIAADRIEANTPRPALPV